MELLETLLQEFNIKKTKENLDILKSSLLKKHFDVIEFNTLFDYKLYYLNLDPSVNCFDYENIKKNLPLDTQDSFDKAINLAYKKKSELDSSLYNIINNKETTILVKEEGGGILMSFGDLKTFYLYPISSSDPYDALDNLKLEIEKEIFLRENKETIKNTILSNILDEGDYLDVKKLFAILDRTGASIRDFSSYRIFSKGSIESLSDFVYMITQNESSHSIDIIETISNLDDFYVLENLILYMK